MSFVKYHFVKYTVPESVLTDNGYTAKAQSLPCTNNMCLGIKKKQGEDLNADLPSDFDEHLIESGSAPAYMGAGPYINLTKEQFISISQNGSYRPEL